jgi:hypothetical protein
VPARPKHRGQAVAVKGEVSLSPAGSERGFFGSGGRSALVVELSGLIVHRLLHPVQIYIE